jgi:hypothetical protein
MAQDSGDAVEGSALAEHLTRQRMPQNVGAQRRRFNAAFEKRAANDQGHWTTVSERAERSATAQKDVVGFDVRTTDLKVRENGVADVLGQWE